MTNRPPKPPFWRRKQPLAKYDIALLRPETLANGERFETPKDVNKESERSEALLGSTVEAIILAGCRSGPACNNTFCPICARRFRKWFIGAPNNFSIHSCLHCEQVFNKEDYIEHVATFIV